MNTNDTLAVPGVTRVAVGNSRLLKVKALPPNQLLLTGLRAGKTMLRVWAGEAAESVYNVNVLPAEETSSGRAEGVVKISVEFLEINSSLTEHLGIRWPDSLQFSLGGVAQGGANFTGLNYTASFSSARGLISALMKEGWAKLLAHPEMLVRLGEQAQFHSGGELPISTSTENYGSFQRSVEWKSFGFSLTVRPQSVDGLLIRSDVKVDVSEVNAAMALEGVPGLMRRTIETKMDSHDGQTVVLSGLMRQMTRKQQAKVPGLSSLPIIGSVFFTEHSEGGEQTEAFMAMTLTFVNRADLEADTQKFNEVSERTP